MRKLLAVIAIGVWAASAYAAQLVVIASNSSSLKPGSMLDGSKELALAEGESITLVSQQGKTMRLEGPYQGQPDAGTNGPQDSLLDSLSKIVTESEKVASLAVFRSTKKKRSPWSVRVTKKGTYCVTDRRTTTLWRPKPLDSTSMAITRTTDNVTVAVEWEQGQQSVPWPDDLQQQDQARYQFSFQDQSPIEIFLRLVPAELASDAHRIIWMSDAGCTKQAHTLLEYL